MIDKGVGQCVKSFVETYLKNHRDYFASVSKYIYEHPETRFEEYQSAAFLAAECEKQGFTVERNVANMKTAFVASYGTGDPVIGFLGEYDALSGLGQKPNALKCEPDGKENGHGCGHNLLGTGAFAAACAMKNYLEKNKLKGTVKFLGVREKKVDTGKVRLW